MSPFDPDTAIGGRRGKFPSTRHTLIDRVQSSEGAVRSQALEEVIAIYWKPLYKYVRLRWHKSNEEAKDLTQAFLTTVIEQEALSGFDPGRGTFRTWLRTLIDRHVTDDLRSSGRIKRGGGLEELDFEAAEVELSEQQSGADSAPDELLRREWVRSVLERSVRALEAELGAAGKHQHLTLFRIYDLEGTDRSYRDLAEELAIPETSVTNWLAATRRRFRSIVLETLESLTASDAEFRSEARDLLGVDP